MPLIKQELQTKLQQQQTNENILKTNNKKRTIISIVLVLTAHVAQS